MFAQLLPADGGSDTKATILVLDGHQLFDVFHIDDNAGGGHAGAQLHQQIGATGENPTGTVCLEQKGRRFLKRAGGHITHVLIALSWVSGENTLNR